VLRKHGWFCCLCGHGGSHRNPIQVDHIKPISTHPELSLVQSNLQVLCRDCNLGKGNSDTIDWRKPRIVASPELIASVQKWLPK
jgi:5-methylcytosine-specific restriction endonuclease McrA